MTTGDSPRDFQPTCTAAVFRARAELLKRVRQIFDQAGFVEVETPLLSQDTMVDRHIEPITVRVANDRRYLQTSPEFAMKRILTIGLPAIYQIARAFRQAERGAHHNPEFTLLEWYRVDDSVDDAMDFTGTLCANILGLPEPTRLSYQEAFQKHVGIDPLVVDQVDLGKLVRKVVKPAPESIDQLDRDELLDILLSDQIQPKLGLNGPLVLFNYPASQAALAAKDDQDPRVAQRFEVYVNGIELANGYGELLDPAEMQMRHARVNELRHKDGNSMLPEKSHLLTAMQHGLPPCSGVALGIDRLVMLATGASTIDEVIAFPFERA